MARERKTEKMSQKDQLAAEAIERCQDFQESLASVKRKYPTRQFQAYWFPGQPLIGLVHCGDRHRSRVFSGMAIRVTPLMLFKSMKQAATAIRETTLRQVSIRTHPVTNKI